MMIEIASADELIHQIVRLKMEVSPRDSCRLPMENECTERAVKSAKSMEY